MENNSNDKPQREVVKSKNGVTIYKEGNMYSLYVEEIKTISITEEFKWMLDKSFDELVKHRK